MVDRAPFRLATKGVRSGSVRCEMRRGMGRIRGMADAMKLKYTHEGRNSPMEALLPPSRHRGRPPSRELPPRRTNGV